MIKFIFNFKANKLQAISYKLNRGMTYVELIVVLSIFSVMTSIVLFNYGEFQAKVDIKNLASEIALKIVEAQKSSLSGKLPPQSQINSISTTWKPSYGLYFNTTDDANKKRFIYFSDLNQNGNLDDASCPTGSECLDPIDIKKGNFIEKIEKCGNTACDSPVLINNPLSITFKRPDSGAFFKTETSGTLTPLTLTGSAYIQITLKSPKNTIAKIKIYPSGRVQVN